jgi:hypothetical protein
MGNNGEIGFGSRQPKEKKKKKSKPHNMDIFGVEPERMMRDTNNSNNNNSHNNGNNNVNDVSQIEDDLTASTTTPTCLEKSEFRRSNLETYENEVFYHVPNKIIGTQVSSAF